MSTMVEDQAKNAEMMAPSATAVRSSAPRFNENDRTVIEALNENFGSAWSHNRDPRYVEEFDGTSLPINVILPLDEHPAAIARATALELRMLKDFHSNITIFVISPEDL